MKNNEILIPCEMSIGSLTIFNVPELNLKGIGLIKEIDYADSLIIENHDLFGDYLTIGNHKQKPHHLYILSDDVITEGDFFIQNCNDNIILRKSVSRDEPYTEQLEDGYYKCRFYNSDENIDNLSRIFYRKKIVGSTNPIIEKEISKEYLEEFIINYNKN